jgi:formylglycine-generating enzyme required for sulfatase activity
VGQFPANAWGLHDVHGNAFEWTQDCWHKNFQGAPEDGSAWLTQSVDEQDVTSPVASDCSKRVLKGGSWSGRPRDLRYAQRSKNMDTFSSIFIGFRVALELSKQ